ncbi:putative F-box associated domain, type 1 [Helianthus annuus]|nr:putative F-box associated domain, type 1 [Helianthus annuus]
MNTPFKSLHFRNTPVVIDGVIYWLAYDDITDKLRLCSFDLASEEFGEVVNINIAVPYYLVGRPRNICMYNISKINESLIVLTPDGFCDCNVWMMLKNGVSQPSFTKLFTLTDVDVDSMIGFRKNGQPIMDHSKTRGFDCELKVYEPCSKRINGLGIYGSAFMMTSYTESLLLLNHSDSLIQ